MLAEEDEDSEMDSDPEEMGEHCQRCSKPPSLNNLMLICDNCDASYHLSCLQMEDEYEEEHVTERHKAWFCPQCESDDLEAAVDEAHYDAERSDGEQAQPVQAVPSEDPDPDGR